MFYILSKKQGSCRLRFVRQRHGLTTPLVVAASPRRGTLNGGEVVFRRGVCQPARLSCLCNRWKMLPMQQNRGSQVPGGCRSLSGNTGVLRLVCFVALAICCSLHPKQAIRTIRRNYRPTRSQSRSHWNRRSCRRCRTRCCPWRTRRSPWRGRRTQWPCRSGASCVCPSRTHT